jgi:TRAP-type C4-dicarboxylate transport system permease large subunit
MLNKFIVVCASIAFCVFVGLCQLIIGGLIIAHPLTLPLASFFGGGILPGLLLMLATPLFFVALALVRAILLERNVDLKEAMGMELDRLLTDGLWPLVTDMQGNFINEADKRRF